MLDAAMKSDAEEDTSEEILTFYCALARQCFINEYVFSYSEDELARATSLRTELMASSRIRKPLSGHRQLRPWRAYFPLLSIPGCDVLLGRPYPECVARLLTQQIAEPMEELA